MQAEWRVTTTGAGLRPFTARQSRVQIAVVGLSRYYRKRGRQSRALPVSSSCFKALIRACATRGTVLRGTTEASGSVIDLAPPAMHNHAFGGAAARSRHAEWVSLSV